jgi:adenosylhomocysteinase
LQKPLYKDKIASTRLILLQHLLPDTEAFVYLLHKAGADIHCVLGKPFSYDKAVKERLENTFRVEVHPYDLYENTEYIDKLLNEAFLKSEHDNKPILIFEVGGYFSQALVRSSKKYSKHLKGVIEVTTFGHNKYVHEAPNIHIPIYSVARSPIKSIEARYVGRAAVVAMDNILRDIGVSIAGREALVIGFGMIGKSVASSLKANNLLVSVYDKKGFARLNAYTLGYQIGDKEDLLKKADIIFSATAEQSLSYDDICKCKNNCILVSVGSKGNEYDIKGLKENSINNVSIGSFIKKYKVNSNKNIFVAREGTAINFTIKSCPDEIVDLIHAEVLTCAEMLLNEHRHRTKLNVVNESPETTLHHISKEGV